MAGVDGIWNVVIKSPMGEQRAKLTVRSAGDTFTGEFTGDEGTVDIADGKVKGDTISWSMKIAKPLPMTLTSTLTLEGDALTGSVTAGTFGSFHQPRSPRGIRRSGPGHSRLLNMLGF